MNSMINEIRKIIDSKFIHEQSSTNILLKEEKSSSCQPFKLLKNNIKTLSLKIDLDEIDVHPILNNTVDNIKKKPDYIIFCKRPYIKKIFCFIIELKSKNPGDWHRQVNGGLILAKYLVGMLENVNKRKIVDIEYRCLLFHALKDKPKVKQRRKTSPKETAYKKHEHFDYKYMAKACNRDYALSIFMH